MSALNPGLSVGSPCCYLYKAVWSKAPQCIVSHSQNTEPEFQELLAFTGNAFLRLDSLSASNKITSWLRDGKSVVGSG
jgi:hypothetical protein